MTSDRGGPVELGVDGRSVSVADRGQSLLDALRDDLGLTAVKDGCSPQGQCGCCTVLVDGAPRVACVTPLRRVRNRTVVTADALPDAAVWAEAFCGAGASQCGFCTPGIVVRLSALRNKTPEAGHDAVESALLAHLSRCTGWRTILDAWDGYGVPAPDRDLAAAERRARLEGGVPQHVGPDVALGHGGFAADTAPPDALVAVADGAGGWSVAETLAEARAAAGKVQGRRTTTPARPPLEVPDGDWAVRLATCWVEPAYLETDASWCEPGGEPASPLANGGAFGGKAHSEVGRTARRLADRYGRPVKVLWSREDVVRWGAKRPPMALGARPDGTGALRAAATEGLTPALEGWAPGFAVEEVDLAGPPTSLDLRGAGWMEPAVVAAAAQDRPVITDPVTGASAEADVEADGTVVVRARTGEALDEVVLRSYLVGAAHQGLSWVTSEALSVDDAGAVLDLTVRSFGVVRAVDTPPIEVELETDGPPVGASGAAMAAVALAVWDHQGRPPAWPTGIPLRS